jgi:hypothetical protein
MNNPPCVVNPKTGRAVKTNGKIGKMILAEKIDIPTAKPIAKPTAKPIAKPTAKPKAKPTAKPAVNTMYKNAKAVRPNRSDFENKPEKIENKNISKSLEALVYDWDTNSLPVLFYQISYEDDKARNMATTIENLYKKGKNIIPSDLFAFYPELLNELIDYYGATKKGIDIIDEGIRFIINYYSDGDDVKMPKNIDYKYYTKYMNSKNKKIFSKLL